MDKQYYIVALMTK